MEYRSPVVLDGVVYLGQWNVEMDAPEGRGIWISKNRVYFGNFEEILLDPGISSEYKTSIADKDTILINADGSIFRGIAY